MTDLLAVHEVPAKAYRADVCIKAKLTTLLHTVLSHWCITKEQIIVRHQKNSNPIKTPQFITRNGTRNSEFKTKKRSDLVQSQYANRLARTGLK